MHGKQVARWMLEGRKMFDDEVVQKGKTADSHANARYLSRSYPNPHNRWPLQVVNPLVDAGVIEEQVTLSEKAGLKERSGVIADVIAGF